MSEAQQVRKLEAVKRSLAIANRVTSSAILEARKSRRRSASPMSGGKKRRKSSPKKSSGKKRGKSPKRK